MSTHEAFKKFIIDTNEEKYGKEIRNKYGNESMDQANKQFDGMNENQMNKTSELGKRINELLLIAFMSGDPSSESAQEVCELHKEWLCMFWGVSAYSKEAHLGIAEMYVEDERFRAYYDSIKEGCTLFLRDALRIYCK